LWEIPRPANDVSRGHFVNVWVQLVLLGKKKSAGLYARVAETLLSERLCPFFSALALNPSFQGAPWQRHCMKTSRPNHSGSFFENHIPEIGSKKNNHFTSMILSHGVLINPVQ
jgi:hypothetical protein